VLYAIHTALSFPSYGSILASGATSLPEQWDGDGSQLHSMLGHADEWLYATLLGIRCTFAACRIEPHPLVPVSSGSETTAPHTVTVAGSYTSASCGLIAVQWNLTVPTGQLHLRVTTPPVRSATCQTLTVRVPTDQLTQVVTQRGHEHTRLVVQEHLQQNDLSGAVSTPRTTAALVFELRQIDTVYEWIAPCTACLLNVV
jgi:hypothetical protein